MGRVCTLDDLIEKNDWRGLNAELAKKPLKDFDALTYFAQGVLWAFGPLSVRNLEGAVVSMERACQLEPGRPRYFNALSECYLVAGRPKQALKTAAGVVSRSGASDPLGYLNVGRAVLALGDFSKAAECFNSALALLSVKDEILKGKLEGLLYHADKMWWEPRSGKRLSLVRFGEEHAGFLAACRQNPEFQAHYNLFQDTSSKSVAADIALTKRSPVENFRIDWVVERSGKPIGVAGLVDLDFFNRRAEIQMGLPNERGYGESLEAALLVLEFAFSVMKLKKLTSYVYSDNPGGQGHTMRLGFKQEGFLRSHVYDKEASRWLDLYVNGHLAEEFFCDKKYMYLCNRFLGRDPRVPGRAG